MRCVKCTVGAGCSARTLTPLRSVNDSRQRAIGVHAPRAAERRVALDENMQSGDNEEFSQALNLVQTPPRNSR
jgi:hypothetical protein